MTLSASDRRYVIAVFIIFGALNIAAWTLRIVVGGEQGRAVAAGILVGAIVVLGFMFWRRRLQGTGQLPRGE